MSTGGRGRAQQFQPSTISVSDVSNGSFFATGTIEHDRWKMLWNFYILSSLSKYRTWLIKAIFSNGKLVHIATQQLFTFTSMRTENEKMRTKGKIDNWSKENLRKCEKFFMHKERFTNFPKLDMIFMYFLTFLHCVLFEVVVGVHCLQHFYDFPTWNNIFLNIKHWGQYWKITSRKISFQLEFKWQTL